MAAQVGDLRALLHSLVNPASNEAYVRDQSTLSNLFKEPEFFVALQSFAVDRSLSQPERLLASVITGRELSKKWRNKTLVPEARKPEIRERLFSFLEEPDMAVRADNALTRTTKLLVLTGFPRLLARSSAFLSRSRVSSSRGSFPISHSCSSTRS